ncbi:MAG: site-specific integrase [Mediterranea sp.]|jgi:site-specific recombinase XerD|nr:site-specific integrase [Mediterranea sp.]
MTTLKLAIIPSKITKDGKHKIRIAVGHKKETRYLVTDIKVNSKNQLRDGVITGHPSASVLNVRLRELLNRYQEAIDKIYVKDYTPAQIIEYLKEYKGSRIGGRTFSAAAQEFIQDKINAGRASTAGLYQITLKHFLNFNKGDTLLELISPRTIKNFEVYLAKNGLNDTTIGMNLIRVKAVINEAIRNREVKYEIHPFEFWKRPESAVKDLDITVEEVRLIRDSKPKEKSLRMARDLFMLSYYLGGINLIDLIEIDFKKATFIEYVRTKTKNTKTGNKKICLTIPDEARPIIKKWIGRNGKLDFGYKYSYPNFRNYVTKELQRLAAILGIEKHVVYYSARKSLTQHGFELGVSLEVLEYTIGQSVKKNRPIFNYVKIMKEHADKAMKKIIDHLFLSD